jgi:hypothetical protein
MLYDTLSVYCRFRGAIELSTDYTVTIFVRVEEETGLRANLLSKSEN